MIKTRVANWPTIVKRATCVIVIYSHKTDKCMGLNWISQMLWHTTGAETVV